MVLFFLDSLWCMCNKRAGELAAGDVDLGLFDWTKTETGFRILICLFRQDFLKPKLDSWNRENSTGGGRTDWIQDGGRWLTGNRQCRRQFVTSIHHPNFDSCLCPIRISLALSREWRCIWGSTERWCSNHIWSTRSLHADLRLILEIWR